MSECNTNPTHHHTQDCGNEKKSCGCKVTDAILDKECPVEFSVQMWGKSFPGAMQAVIQDILKEKIRKAWGPMMEKEGDAVVEALGKSWKAHMETKHAAYDLRQNIKKVFEEASKQ